MDGKTPILYIVIPCYNEEAVLPYTMNVVVDKLTELMEQHRISMASRVLFVDDGSKDETWNLIRDAAKVNEKIRGLKESRNNGHQNALMAGMLAAQKYADCVITMDCDGQDDISVIGEMVSCYTKEHCEIVYGVRKARKKDSWFKRKSAEWYYKLLHKFGADVVYNHADFRLVSSRVLQELQQYQEVNLFLRGLFPLLGFKSSIVFYNRENRVAGESKYSLQKMVSFAVDGVTSLTVKPLVSIMMFGFLIAGISFIGCIWALVSYMLGSTVQGWASMTCIVCFVCGVQLICVGVLGIYIGKIYMEVKHRPRYIIEEKTWDE